MSKQLVIKTAQLNYQQRGSEVVLNTTIGSGEGIGKVFAPTWEMVKGSKAGRISWEEYTRQYIELMRKRWLENREAFERAVLQKKLVLTCYCAHRKNCHRHLLKDILIKVAASMGISATDGGEELTWSNKRRKTFKRPGAKHKRSPRR